MVSSTDFNMIFCSSSVGMLEIDRSLSIFLRKLLIPSLKRVVRDCVIFCHNNDLADQFRFECGC